MSLLSLTPPSISSSFSVSVCLSQPDSSVTGSFFFPSFVLYRGISIISSHTSIPYLSIGNYLITAEKKIIVTFIFLCHIILSAFVFIYINVTNCYSPCTVMKSTDILLHGLPNRSLTLCRTESSVLWVILAKSSCCLVQDVCVSGCLYVQRPPPLTEQTWAPAADWGALILLIHLCMQCFAITFNNLSGIFQKDCKCILAYGPQEKVSPSKCTV